MTLVKKLKRPPPSRTGRDRSRKPVVGGAALFDDSHFRNQPSSAREQELSITNLNAPASTGVSRYPVKLRGATFHLLFTVQNVFLVQPLGHTRNDKT